MTKILGYSTVVLFLLLAGTGWLLKGSWEARASERATYEANAKQYTRTIISWMDKYDRAEAARAAGEVSLVEAQRERERISRDLARTHAAITELRRHDQDTADWFDTCDLTPALFDCLRWGGDCHHRARDPGR